MEVVSGAHVARTRWTCVGAVARERVTSREIREMNAPRPGREVGERDRRSRCEIRDVGRAVPGDFHECWPMRGQM